MSDNIDKKIDDILQNAGNPKEVSRLINMSRGNDVLAPLLERELKNHGLLSAGTRKLLRYERKEQSFDAPDLEVPQVLPHNMPLNPDLWAPMQTSGKEAKPLSTIDNFKILLQSYGVDVSFDLIRKELKINYPDQTLGGCMQDSADLAQLGHLCNLNRLSDKTVANYVCVLANSEPYNPVLDYVEQKKWDGVDRFEDLFKCFTLHPDEDYALTLDMFKRWLRGAAGIGTGFIKEYESVLVLVDPKGGAGKTRFFKTLARDDLIKESVRLKLDDKDSIKIALSYWLVELGELDATFSKSGTAALKAFFSNSVDEMRMPYGRTYEKYQRHTAFIGTVNSVNFLNDASDNRRFWPIRVLSCDFEHDIDVQQVWAQALHELKNGEMHYYDHSDSESIAARNERFRALSRVTECLSIAYPRDQDCGVWTAISTALANAGVINASKADMAEAADFFRKRNYNQRRKNGVVEYYTPVFKIKGEY